MSAESQIKQNKKKENKNRKHKKWYESIMLVFQASRSSVEPIWFLPVFSAVHSAYAFIIIWTSCGEPRDCTRTFRDSWSGGRCRWQALATITFTGHLNRIWREATGLFIILSSLSPSGHRKGWAWRHGAPVSPVLFHPQIDNATWAGLGGWFSQHMAEQSCCVLFRTGCNTGPLSSTWQLWVICFYFYAI